MKATVNSLELVTVVLQTLHDDDAVWDDFLDAKTKRVRNFLREKLRLTREVAVLTNQQAQLHQLLREHELSMQAIASMLDARPIDDWEVSVKQWRDVARKHYQPWSLDAYQDEMDAALKVLNAFNWSTDKETSGLSFFGWREARSVDPVRGTFKFQFSKTFLGYDVMDHMNVCWDTYMDVTLYNKVMMGSHARGDLEVLQQLGPNIMIVRTTVRCSRIDVDAHSVFLVFRVRTERGFTQCVRSIWCPELMHKLDGPCDMWPTNFIWNQWELLDGMQGYKVRIGGSSGEIDLNYATMWMTAAFGCVLRSETIATGRKLVISS